MKFWNNISLTAATAVCCLLIWLLTVDDCLSWEVLDRRFWNANFKVKTAGSRIHVGDEFVSPFTYVRKGKLASRRPKTPPLSGKYPSSRPRDRRPWRRLLYLAMKRRYTSRRLTKFRLLYFSFESGGKDDDDERRGEGGENSREEGKDPFPTLEEKFLRMAEKCWLRSSSPHFAAAAYRWRRLWAISEPNMLFYFHLVPLPPKLHNAVFTYDILKTLTSLLGGFVWKPRSFAKLSLSALTFVYRQKTVQGVRLDFIRGSPPLQINDSISSRLSSVMREFIPIVYAIMWLLILINVLYSLYFIAVENWKCWREQVFTNLRLASAFHLIDKSIHIYLVTSVNIFAANEPTTRVLSVLTYWWQEDISHLHLRWRIGGKNINSGLIWFSLILWLILWLLFKTLDWLRKSIKLRGNSVT